MGREVRRVHKDWEHPTNGNGYYIPLYDGSSIDRHREIEREYGDELDEFKYMPKWDEDEMTHIQMYEDTTEGTPISPVFDNAEDLARWLADNNASAFASMTATYDQWLSMIQAGYAPSMVVHTGRIESGVEASIKTRTKV
jgi:hypothetical protein